MNPHALTPDPHARLRRSPARFLARAALPLALLLCAATSARTAWGWETPAESLVAVAPDPRSLRTAVASLARSREKRDPQLASAALYWRGVSFAREGQADSAIVSFERAARIFTFDEEQLARADAWMARGRAGLADSAASLMMRVAPFAEVDEDRAPYRARLAWALFLSGKADSAMRVFRPISPYIGKDLVWRERMGRTAVAAHDARIAQDLLLPVVVETRGADRAALDALHTSLGPNQDKRLADLDGYLRQKWAEQEAAERGAVERMGGHRLNLTASDGFPLGAALFVPSPGCPVAVIMMGSGDSLAVYDSLVTRMNDSGLAALLLERRGSGGSIGQGMAIASDAYGREEALESRMARDPLDALRAVARLVQLDTTRVALVGVHDAVPTTIRAATLMPRAHALLLISPIPTLIDLGPARARLAKLQRPVFIQIAMDEGYMFHSSDIYMDALYRGGAPGASRIVEAHQLGGGPALFRQDHTLWPRIEQWMHAAFSAPSATRPPPRRKG